MTATAEAKPWDFSHVLDLVNSLSHLPEQPCTPLQKTKELDLGGEHILTTTYDGGEKDANQDELTRQLQGLGDFSKLWQFLGSGEDSPKAALAIHTPQNHSHSLPSYRNSAGYASDGALPPQASSKVKSTSKQKQTLVPSQDQSSAEDQGGDTASDGSTFPETPTLTKSQRKKRNRRLRRAQEAALAEEQAAKKVTTAVSDSEAHNVSRKTPAKAGELPIVETTPKHHYNLRSRDASGKAVCADNLDNAISVAVKKVDAAKKAHREIAASQQDGAPATQDSHLHETSLRRQSNPALLPSHNGTISAYDALHTRPALDVAQWTASSDNAHLFVPSTVAPVPYSTRQPAFVQAQSVPKQITGTPKATKVIEPMITRSGEDRHWALFIKLISDFYEDRKHLISPMNLTTHNNNPKGIHVFVDASNIFIGFTDQLKRSRGIPWNVQVPAVDLSFDALALLMERRRPVAKRVLVGSTPHLAAFDKAKAVGYECSILEKVYKARELTERQIYFKELDHANHMRKRAKAPPANNVATVNGQSGSGSGSGSETNAPQYAPARMIEQGVDEILHLKVLESIVDTDVPGTIVLATGDAARAEYSEGFMAMAERALKKGWTVELVSWSKNISAMYTRREWVQAWGERFRIVTLDDYAEELLDM